MLEARFEPRRRGVSPQQISLKISQNYSFPHSKFCEYIALDLFCLISLFGLVASFYCTCLIFFSLLIPSPSFLDFVIWLFMRVRSFSFLFIQRVYDSYEKSISHGID